MLYQLYAYVLPAFSKQQQRVIVPLLLLSRSSSSPASPSATSSCCRRRPSSCSTSTTPSSTSRSGPATTTASSRPPCSPAGIVFQLPVGDPRRHPARDRQGRAADQEPPLRLSGCAIVAAALPGVDPVSMLLETAPLIVLYEFSDRARQDRSGTPRSDSKPSLRAPERVPRSSVPHLRPGLGDRSIGRSGFAGAPAAIVAGGQVAGDHRVGADHAALADR